MFNVKWAANNDWGFAWVYLVGGFSHLHVLGHGVLDMMIILGSSSYLRNTAYTYVLAPGVKLDLICSY